MKTKICTKCDCIRQITAFPYNSRTKNNGTRTRQKTCRQCIKKHKSYLWQFNKTEADSIRDPGRELRAVRIPELMARAEKGLELCVR